LSLRATTSEGVVDSPSWLDCPLEEVRAACDNSDKVPSCRPNARHEHVEVSGRFAPIVCRAAGRKKVKDGFVPLMRNGAVLPQLWHDASFHLLPGDHRHRLMLHYGKRSCFHIDKQAAIVGERPARPHSLPGVRLGSASGKLRRWLTLWKVHGDAPRLWVEAKLEQALFLLNDKVIEVALNLLA
jgi:hypothetical protein